jgi:hypothetical protein
MSVKARRGFIGDNDSTNTDLFQSILACTYFMSADAGNRTNYFELFLAGRGCVPRSGISRSNVAMTDAVKTPGASGKNNVLRLV